MSRILLYGSGEKKKRVLVFLSDLSVNTHVFAQREAGRRSEGWEEECHLHCGRGCLGGRTSATYLRQKGHRHYPPSPQRLRLPRTCAAERQSGRRDRLPLCGGSGGTRTLRGRVTDRLEPPPPPPPPSENSRSQRRGRGRDREKTRRNSWS